MIQKWHRLSKRNFIVGSFRRFAHCQLGPAQPCCSCVKSGMRSWIKLSDSSIEWLTRRRAGLKPLLLLLKRIGRLVIKASSRGGPLADSNWQFEQQPCDEVGQFRNLLRVIETPCSCGSPLWRLAPCLNTSLLYDVSFQTKIKCCSIVANAYMN